MLRVSMANYRRKTPALPRVWMAVKSLSGKKAGQVATVRRRFRLDFIRVLGHTGRVKSRRTSIRRAACFSAACLAAGAALLSAACSAAFAPAPASGSLAKDFIVPRAGRDIYLGGQSPAPKTEADLKITAQAKTTLGTDQIIQDIREENLDADPSLEQLIVYKQKDDQEDLLRILAVDFDEAKGVWANTWQGATRASNIKTFSIRVLNLNNVSLPEIVCQGTNSQGEQTLDIFHITGKGEFPLAYLAVLSVSADINIEITQAGVASPDGAAPAAPPGTIIAQSKDLESTSPLDMVETRYQWKGAAGAQAPGQYLVVSSAKIPGATVQEAALDQLFKSSAAEVERKFLDGGWVHSFVNQRKRKITQILFFDSDARSIRLVEGDRMEAHSWLSTYKPAYGSGIKVYTVNESFHSQRTEGSVRVTGLNSLEFSLAAADSASSERNDWQGVFTRLSGDMAAEYFAANGQTTSSDSLVLSGLYRNEGGIEVIFDGSRFTWRDAGHARQGGFATYRLNEPVLEMEFVDEKGLVEERAWYIAKASELEQGKQTQRVLELQPASITVGGVAALARDPLRLEQAPLDLSR
jgi:hypothetical protein